MQKKIRRRNNKANEGSDNLENMLWKDRPKNKANKSQKSTAANSSMRNSEENNNMVIESNNPSEHDDAKIIKMEQVNLESKNDFFEDKKDSNEVKGEQYDLMECESEDEKIVNEENKIQPKDVPENASVNETLTQIPINIKEILCNYNNEIMNSGLKEENIGKNNNNNINSNIRPENTAKKRPMFKTTKYKQKNNNSENDNCNDTIISDLNCNENLFLEPEEANNDERLSLSEIKVDTNRPYLNRGLTEALFANARNIFNNNNNTIGRNTAFYEAFDLFCNKETCFKTNFK